MVHKFFTVLLFFTVFSIITYVIVDYGPSEGLYNKKSMTSLCHEKYLNLPKRNIPQARNSEWMQQREIIYKKRNNKIRSVCEKYKEIGVFQGTNNRFTPPCHLCDKGDCTSSSRSRFWFDVKNHLAFCRIPKVNKSQSV